MQTPALEPLLKSVASHTPLYRKSNVYFHSRVYRIQGDAGEPIALKVVEPKDERHGALLAREHEFLLALGEPRFAEHAFHGRHGEAYVLATRWIDGYVLHGQLERFRAEVATREARERFAAELRVIVERLEEAEIEHRDLWEKNILVRAGRPCLIDFGWAVWLREDDPPTPPELREPDDRVALARLERLVLG